MEMSPPELTRVNLRSSGGSTANEGAIKIAQWITGKRDVIVPFRGHVGQSIAATSYNGTSRMREPFPYHLPGAVHVPEPYCFRCFYRQTPDTCGMWCVDRIEDFITYASSGSVAAMIIEPISGVGGNVVPPPGYLERLKEFCEEREIVLIFDENQTGLGRTGQLFAADHFGVTPAHHDGVQGPDRAAASRSPRSSPRSGWSACRVRCTGSPTAATPCPRRRPS